MQKLESFWSSLRRLIKAPTIRGDTEVWAYVFRGAFQVPPTLITRLLSGPCTNKAQVPARSLILDREKASPATHLPTDSQHSAGASPTPSITNNLVQEVRIQSPGTLQAKFKSQLSCSVPLSKFFCPSDTYDMKAVARHSGSLYTFGTQKTEAGESQV